MSTHSSARKDKELELLRIIFDTACSPGCSHEGETDEAHQKYWAACKELNTIGYNIDLPYDFVLPWEKRIKEKITNILYDNPEKENAARFQVFDNRKDNSIIRNEFIDYIVFEVLRLMNPKNEIHSSDERQRVLNVLEDSFDLHKV